MSEYYPDAWVIIKIQSEEITTFRVLAGWYGGYLGSDSWKINSGIISYTEDANGTITFYGSSGSTYKGHKQCERFTGLTHSVFKGYVEESKSTDITIEHLDFNDFKTQFKKFSKS